MRKHILLWVKRKADFCDYLWYNLALCQILQKSTSPFWCRLNFTFLVGHYHLASIRTPTDHKVSRVFFYKHATTIKSDFKPESLGTIRAVEIVLHAALSFTKSVAFINGLLLEAHAGVSTKPRQTDIERRTGFCSI